MEQEPEGGLPFGELWFEVICRFAADILAAEYRRSPLPPSEGEMQEFIAGRGPDLPPSEIDAAQFFQVLEATYRRHHAEPLPPQPPAEPRWRLLADPGPVELNPFFGTRPRRSTPYEAAEPDTYWNWFQPGFQPANPQPSSASPTRPLAEDHRVVTVRKDVLACLGDDRFVAWGHSLHASLGEPRRPFVSGDWRPPWQIRVFRSEVRRGRYVPGQGRERVREVKLYCLSPAPGREKVPAGIVKAVAVRLLETHKKSLVKTNGLLAAATAIHGMMDMERPVLPDTVRVYIESRYWELVAEMGIEPSPTSPQSKRSR